MHVIVHNPLFTYNYYRLLSRARDKKKIRPMLGLRQRSKYTCSNENNTLWSIAQRLLLECFQYSKKFHTHVIVELWKTWSLFKLAASWWFCENFFVLKNLFMLNCKCFLSKIVENVKKHIFFKFYWTFFTFLIFYTIHGE